LSWDGTSQHEHRFGGIEFRLGNRELGHLHGESLLDIPFPLSVRNDLVSAGQAEQHHVLPQSGWVSFRIRNEEDIDRATSLLRRSYDLARESKQKRTNDTRVTQPENT